MHLFKKFGTGCILIIEHYYFSAVINKLLSDSGSLTIGNRSLVIDKKRGISF
jgi:hypothetical protein